MSNENAEPLRLGDTGLTVLPREEDLRGRPAVDRAGEEIGHVRNLLTDEWQTRARFVQITASDPAGADVTRFLIPADVITAIGEEAVYLDQTREEVMGAPPYEPDTAKRSDYEAIESYYGIETKGEAEETYRLYPFYLG